MTQSSNELRIQMERANQRLMRKFWAIAIVIVLAFFFCVFFDGVATGISRWSAIYVPSVAKLRQSPSEIGFLPANYFGVLAVLMPAFVIWLAWGENPRMRWRYGAQQSGRGPTEFLFVLYLLGLPTCMLILFVMYAAPIEMPAQPRLWGQHIVHLMLNTYLGLLGLGGFAALGTALLGAVTLFYSLLPLAAINNVLFKGKI